MESFRRCNPGIPYCTVAFYQPPRAAELSPNNPMAAPSPQNDELMMGITVTEQNFER